MSKDHLFKTATIPGMNRKSPNSTLSFKGFHISYNRSSRDYRTDTTAIVIKGNLFLILNSDHKTKLVDCAESNGLNGVINYFIEHLDQSNPKSEHNNIAGILRDDFNLKDYAFANIGKELTEKLILKTKELNNRGKL